VKGWPRKSARHGACRSRRRHRGFFRCSHPRLDPRRSSGRNFDLHNATKLLRIARRQRRIPELTQPGAKASSSLCVAALPGRWVIRPGGTVEKSRPRRRGAWHCACRAGPRPASDQISVRGRRLLGGVGGCGLASALSRLVLRVFLGQRLGNGRTLASACSAPWVSPRPASPPGWRRLARSLYLFLLAQLCARVFYRFASATFSTSGFGASVLKERSSFLW